jgi:hypothetical protein
MLCTGSGIDWSLESGEALPQSFHSWNTRDVIRLVFAPSTQLECRGACSLAILEPLLLHMCVIDAHARATTENNEESLSSPTVYRGGERSTWRGETTRRSKLRAGGHRSIPKTRFRIRVLDEAGMGQAGHRPVAPMDIKQVSSMKI